MVLLAPMGGPPLPTFSDEFASVTVLAPTRGSSGTSCWPGFGAPAVSPRANSSGLLVLKEIRDDNSCVPAVFATRSSGECCDPPGVAGPLTVVRLLRREADESSPLLDRFALAMH